MATKRTGNISNAQKSELVDFVENHPQLISGKFFKDFSFKTAQSMWEQLEGILNALPGAKKDWKQWRKTWHDMKCATKSKKSGIDVHMRQTGGGPPSGETFSVVENKILEIIGPVAIGGHPDTIESQATFTMEEEEAIPNPGEISEATPSNNHVVPVNNNPSTSEASTNFSTHVPSQNVNNEKEVLSSKPKRVQRLDNTIQATHRLADQDARKIEIQRDYYERKLRLYAEDVETKKRIANALEIIANKISKE